ncbi:hypothetical protein WEH80_03385 [Actinomycetes bacterium KLBMP 9759]
MTDTSHQLPDPPSVAEIAALTTRLRELSTAGSTADPAARAAFLADKQELLDRITDGQDRYPEPNPRDIPVSRTEAAEELVALGHEPDRARQMVTDYLHDTSRRIGVPVYQWGLDMGDVEAIVKQHQGADVPEPRVSVEEQERRAQLNQWHADDADGVAATASHGGEDGRADR